MKKIYLLILLSLAVKTVNAQQPCGTYEYETHLGAQFPGFTEALGKLRNIDCEFSICGDS